jgi:6,7-dimethyl-8-ribityllumazine synthase
VTGALSDTAMLKTIAPRAPARHAGRFAIVASQYNGRYVDAMLRSARKEFARAGISDLQIVRVPGAFEIPAVAARLAYDHHPPLSAIICLGVIFQGETSHAHHVGDGVTRALAQLQVQHRMPFIHGVYLFDSEEQARVRCLGTKHNRGIEVARTALTMARVMSAL